ncbi:LacI family DNA-binding transcriptional regulator, partial [Streptomyces sp. NPDC002586]
MVQIPNTPTSADVARLAGVSRATVSYVLNNTSAVRISEPTRRRVHEAARELGYVPHAAARSLRAGHSRMVLMPAPAIPVGSLYSGFINDPLSTPFFLRLLDRRGVRATFFLLGSEAHRT